MLLVGVQVYRGNRWLKMSSEELLPGDIVSIGELFIVVHHVVEFSLLAHSRFGSGLGMRPSMPSLILSLLTAVLFY